MTRRQRQKENKNTLRDTLTNKRVGNKEVITVDNAIDYVKKQGYLVIIPRRVEELAMITFYISFILLIGVSK